MDDWFKYVKCCSFVVPTCEFSVFFSLLALFLCLPVGACSEQKNLSHHIRFVNDLFVAINFWKNRGTNFVIAWFRENNTQMNHRLVADIKSLLAQAEMARQRHYHSRSNRKTPMSAPEPS